ncbi:transcriptional regulator [Alsobacter soli]|uniref:Transcriptional regulator n=1 Tax=Alsobacter soli TaxID=2109933 RepID=A0A2T1HYI1_9HYPH|nr:Crp/Fnr family transcriptional regulator [Alsobacter soli]PSC06675.1 transcriptional regulator [Alsobacter soli]
MSLDPRFSDEMRDRLPPKHDARWTLGISRRESMDEPVEKATRHLDLAARECVLDEGDEARSLYVILEGAVMLSKLLPDGRRQIIELLGPGDIFGLSTNRLSDVTAETVLPARIVVYDRHTAESSAALQRLVSERMKAQICALHDHAVLLGRKTAVERVATFLMRLVPNRGGAGCAGPLSERRPDQANVRVPLTRQEIADYLGLTLETVSRAFSQLKREGFLVYGRHDEVTIANVCRLCKCTGSH